MHDAELSPSGNAADPDASQVSRPSTLRSALSGMRQGLPIVFGYIPVGFAYGVLAQKSGISVEGTVAMSVFLFAGSAQFIAVDLISRGVPMASIILTIFVVNLRHLLMSAALAPYLKKWPARLRWLFAFELTDETFAVHAGRFAKGDRPRAETLALNVTAQSSWVGGGLLGALFSELLADDKVFGLDFAMPAMFIALLAGQCRRGGMFALAALIGAAASVLLVLAGINRWNIIFATLIAATLATLLDWPRKSAPSGGK